MDGYRHGQMDIRQQEQTWEGFMRFTARAVMAIVAALILLALIGA